VRASSGARAAVLVCLCALVWLSVAARPAFAQVAARVTQPVDAKSVVMLKGNVHPLARAEFDRGAAPDSLAMNRMLLVLKKSDEQEAALRKLLDDQQDKNSKSYRQWLTPDEFGAQFGIADSDLAKVTAWLAAAGFQNIKPSRGRTVIEFSGTAGQVQAAFGTAIHKYVVNGAEHWANASEMSIPAALEPVVAGVFTMHNFLKAPQIQVLPEKYTAVKGKPGARPMFTSSTGAHALMPQDFYKIYNETPVKGNPGAPYGAKIGVVARTNINFADLSAFHDIADDQAAEYQLVLNGTDPGDLGGGEEAEAVLDSSWSGAIAPQSEVLLVVSQSTPATDGADLSEVYIIDNNLADVMSESFGSCEGLETSAEAQGIASLAGQAAAQGITYVVASGDSGAAGCDDPNTETTATHANSVNVLAATPYNVAVGGTVLNDAAPGTYWNSSNGDGQASALSYIPENVWNDSCAKGQTGCTNPGIWASGGGASSFVTKPSWQAGVTGIPADGQRDVPDVSFSAAAHDPYLICLRNSCQESGTNPTVSFAGVSGTSASTPVFAGIMALVGTQMGVRLGQANYVLYRLAAAETFSQCNGSSKTTTVASSCVFNDVTLGNNAVPGESGYGTPTAKYQAGTGYDLATGLGSLNIANLLSKWNSVTFSPTTTTLTISPTTAVHGTAVMASGNVTPNSGNGVPTGNVWLIPSAPPVGQIVPPGSVTGSLQNAAIPVGAQGAFSASVNTLSGGTYTVGGHYSGDGTYAGSDATPPVSVTITPEPTTLDFSVSVLGQGGTLVPATTVPYGTYLYLAAQLHWASGVGGSDLANLEALEILAPYGEGGPGVLDNNGHFSSKGILTVGTYSSMTAQFLGTPDFQASNVVTVPTFTVAQANTTTSLALQNSGTALTLTATVSAAGAGWGPSGTVTLTSGGNTLGTISLPGNGPTGGTSVQSVGTFDATQLAAGQYNVVANYSGDQSYVGSTSSVVSLSLNKDFSINTQGPTSTTVSAGQLAQWVNGITGAGFAGFTGTVNLACSLPASATGTQCTLNPTSFTFPSLGSGLASVSVTTTSRTTSGGAAGEWGHWPSNWKPGLAIWVVLFSVAAVLASMCALARKRRLLWVLGTASLLAVIMLAACGGGSGSNSSGNGGGTGGTGTGGTGTGGGTPNPNGTPAGTYTVTVTGTSGTTSHTATLTLVVN
jgi:Pro-kumamolisin, activation domain/Bacterial Ig-like domain (group 3)